MKTHRPQKIHRPRTCVYRGVGNACFSENFAQQLYAAQSFEDVLQN